MTTTLLEKEIGTDVMTDVMEFTLLGKFPKEKKQKIVRINVTDALGKYPKPGRKRLHVSDEDGKQIFTLLKQALDKNYRVSLCCHDLDPDGGFIRHAIGQLYAHFNMRTVDHNIQLLDLDSHGQFTLESTLRIDKLYHYHRNVYNHVVERIAEETGENREDWL
jgi:hypothetical protein